MPKKSTKAAPRKKSTAKSEPESHASAASAAGKALVIVESPTKAKTIAKFLGPDYVIEASVGHVRDLPESKKDLPEEHRKEDWSYLGVDIHHGFQPVYIVPNDKKKQVQKLRSLARTARAIFLATDEDREGEAISWHLLEELKPKVPVQRMVFHEITREAIQRALEAPRAIDQNLVRAQETRRILDRLYGYDLSRFLWKCVGHGSSAGRVQSVAIRLIVERERERIAFHSATYWDLLGLFAKKTQQQLQAQLVSLDDRRIPTGKDFDSTTGKLTDSNLLLLNEAQAQEWIAKLQTAEFKVASVEENPYISRPYPPFTTSTLQQEALRKLGFKARHTMKVAQSLYEQGHITYMRTDSTNLAQEAIQAARRLISDQYGPAFLPEKPRFYSTKVKNAQEAHEAIRPSGQFTMPEQLRKELDSEDHRKLYDLIWKRTIACQMTDAKMRSTKVAITGGGAKFQATGRVIDFPGYLRAYVEGSDDPDADLADKDQALPPLSVGEPVDCKKLDAKSHTTQPPARFTEASLIKELEQRGIGRPSTYAAILETITGREYAFYKGSALVPTWSAFTIVQLLEELFPDLIDYQFTARMEDDLDAISRGESEQGAYLQNFYFGTQQPGLKKQLEQRDHEIKDRDFNRIVLGTPEGQTDLIMVRVPKGKSGPYLQQGERKANLPKELPPDELGLTEALALLAQSEQTAAPLGYTSTQQPIFLRSGQWGWFVQRGNQDDPQKSTAKLLKGMTPEQVDLAMAEKLLSLPREVGLNPANNEPIIVSNGMYGCYLKCGSETRSLTDGLSPFDLTLEQALHVLAQPKAPRRGAGAPKEPLKTFPESPVTGKPIQLLKGFYGPYVTDGTTNASLPRGSNVEEVTLEQALTLLAERAAAGPSKRPARRGGGGRKKASRKSAS